MRIDGKTAVLAHLAYPSAHLRTPQAFNRRCAERGLNAVLVPWQVRPANLASTMSAMRYAESLAGLVVTIPHKETAARLCDRLEGVAELLDVVNVIRRDRDGTLVGRALDGDGFVAGLRREGVETENRSALIVGAGGVALSIAAALLEAGIGSLRVANRTAHRAEAMIGRLRMLAAAHGLTTDIGAAPPEAAAFDIAVNATSLGMHPGDPLPMGLDGIGADSTIAEVVMSPDTTPLLVESARRGARVVPGHAMLDGQIDPFIDFVLGGPAAPGSLPSPPFGRT